MAKHKKLSESQKAAQERLKIAKLAWSKGKTPGKVDEGTGESSGESPQTEKNTNEQHKNTSGLKSKKPRETPEEYKKRMRRLGYVRPNNTINWPAYCQHLADLGGFANITEYRKHIAKRRGFVDEITGEGSLTKYGKFLLARKHANEKHQKTSGLTHETEEQNQNQPTTSRSLNKSEVYEKPPQTPCSFYFYALKTECDPDYMPPTPAALTDDVLDMLKNATTKEEVENIISLAKEDYGLQLEKMTKDATKSSGKKILQR